MKRRVIIVASIAALIAISCVVVVRQFRNAQREQRWARAIADLERVFEIRYFNGWGPELTELTIDDQGEVSRIVDAIRSAEYVDYEWKRAPREYFELQLSEKTCTTVSVFAPGKLGYSYGGKGFQSRSLDGILDECRARPATPTKWCPGCYRMRVPKDGRCPECGELIPEGEQ